MKKSIVIVFGIALLAMISGRSYCQRADAVKLQDSLAAAHELEVAYESKMQGEKDIHGSRVQDLTSVVALEGIFIAILIPIVFVQRKKIKRLKGS